MDPFSSLPEIVFGEIKNLIVDGENRKALTQLSRLIITMIREMPPSDSSVIDIIKNELRISQIIMRKETAEQIDKANFLDHSSEIENDENSEDDKVNNNENNNESNKHFPVRPPSENQETSTRQIRKPQIRVSSQILPNDIQDQLSS